MLTVELKHASNPDIDGGYWQDGNPHAKRHVLPVQNIEAASVVCRQYIERNGLGGGNWTGGAVKRDGVMIGKISYNGRFWPMDKLPCAC